MNLEFSNYYGEKGYTIYKKTLNNTIISKIKKELTVKPFSSINTGYYTDVSYNIFLENTNKIYIPYFYGLKNFGIPKSFKISNPERIPDIYTTYAGYDLRDKQKIVVNKYLEHIQFDSNKESNNNINKTGGLLELHTGFGKTLIAMYLISQLKYKTIIIVQKEFLMEQWIENICRSLPNARIGKIQGETIDIENKDIVIGMLQSLSMKEYPSSIFSSFGFLIVDEVHHISSNVFSKALFKINTYYTLGLSATMDRKDKTDWVFKLFLGDIIHKEKQRDIDYGVVVRAVEYKMDDSLYENIQCDAKGNPLYSCMISKICEYNLRTHFILRLIYDTLKENPNQQIMVLAQNRNILNYLYELITKNTGNTGNTGNKPLDISIGYYLGGMKKIDLKISESKTIILATYAMASEALDIKTLTTLFMITSKSDIVQSVGRILRDKNESSPVIYDIIDSHQIFKNQWRKRMSFYKKEGYKIIKTNNVKYTSDISQWDVEWDKNNKHKKNVSDDSNEETLYDSLLFIE